MHRPPAWIAALLVVGLSASGCHQPLPPAPSVTPEPTFACTPEAGGGPSFSCDRRQHEEMVAKEALYAEAEKVYREFQSEDFRIQWHSSEGAPSAIITERATGSFLAHLAAAYATVRKEGFSGAGGEPSIVYVRRVPAATVEGSLVALESCLDGSKAPVLRKGKQVGSGVIVRNTYFFSRVSGQLKISAFRGGQVQGC